MAIYPTNKRVSGLEKAWVTRFTELNGRPPNDLDKLNMTNSIVIDIMCELLDTLGTKDGEG